ncbi:MAG: hypothetical protein ISS56_06635 [Anaerolineae bacterium]|nr:hypothetical protein [Anaerolineae bacterium]
MKKEGVFAGIWKFLKPVLLVDLGLFLLVGGSFLLRGEFTFAAYSERLFWAGMAAVVVGGFGVWASLGSYSTLGTPSILTASGDAQIAHSRIAEHMQTNSKRYTFVFRMFATGLVCMVSAALIDMLSR